MKPPPAKVRRNVLEHGLAHITIRNVADHDRGALFSAVANRINIDGKLLSWMEEVSKEQFSNSLAKGLGPQKKEHEATSLALPA